MVLVHLPEMDGPSKRESALGKLISSFYLTPADQKVISMNLPDVLKPFEIGKNLYITSKGIEQNELTLESIGKGMLHTTNLSLAIGEMALPYMLVEYTMPLIYQMPYAGAISITAKAASLIGSVVIGKDILKGYGTGLIKDT